MFPVGRLEACLLLPLLVSLLHLALAHPAWGQKDGVITAHYSSYRQRETEREPGYKGKTDCHLTSDQRIRIYREQILINSSMSNEWKNKCFISADNLNMCPCFLSLHLVYLV